MRNTSFIDELEKVAAPRLQFSGFGVEGNGTSTPLQQETIWLVITWGARSKRSPETQNQVVATTTLCR